MRGTLPVSTLFVCISAIVGAPTLHGQSARITFEAATVKPSDGVQRSNVNLSGQDDLHRTGGYLSANYELDGYLAFAYKLNANQLRLVNLPKWARTSRFAIDARALGDPTTDQMRSMLRSLLAERFQLAVHFETQVVPVYALVKDSSAGPGAQLTPHRPDAPCAVPPVPPSPHPANDDSWPPPVCGVMLGHPPVNGRMGVAARDMTVQQIAESFWEIPFTGLDRPVIDQTGLVGSYDFKVEFAPDLSGSGARSQADMGHLHSARRSRSNLGWN